MSVTISYVYVLIKSVLYNNNSNVIAFNIIICYIADLNTLNRIIRYKTVSKSFNVFKSEIAIH